MAQGTCFVIIGSHALAQRPAISSRHFSGNNAAIETQVTDIGPKDSNFPQNAWGLLDSTAHNHIFSVKPGNSDHIFSVIPGNSDAIKVEQFSCQLSKYLTFVFVVLPPAYLASNRAVLRRQIQKLIFLPWNLVTVWP